MAYIDMVKLAKLLNYKGMDVLDTLDSLFEIAEKRFKDKNKIGTYVANYDKNNGTVCLLQTGGTDKSDRAYSWQLESEFIHQIKRLTKELINEISNKISSRVELLPVYLLGKFDYDLHNYRIIYGIDYMIDQFEIKYIMDKLTSYEKLQKLNNFKVRKVRYHKIK